jgi:hypothetical protein
MTLVSISSQTNQLIVLIIFFFTKLPSYLILHIMFSLQLNQACIDIWFVLQILLIIIHHSILNLDIDFYEFFISFELVSLNIESIIQILFHFYIYTLSITSKYNFSIFWPLLLTPHMHKAFQYLVSHLIQT